MYIPIMHRDGLGGWLNQLNELNNFKNNEMAEIGCCTGAYSRVVLNQWKGSVYWMIDPWKVQDRRIYRERQPDQQLYDEQFQECQGLALRDTRIRIIRDISVNASKQFENEQLACVYLDGNHSYDGVMSDLDAWWPKVAPRGVLCGHDFQTKTDEGWFCEVDSAVTRWTGRYGVQFVVTPCAGWWIEKK